MKGAGAAGAVVDPVGTAIEEAIDTLKDKALGKIAWRRFGAGRYRIYFSYREAGAARVAADPQEVLAEIFEKQARL